MGCAATKQPQPHLQPCEYIAACRQLQGRPASKNSNFVVNISPAAGPGLIAESPLHGNDF